MTVVIHFPALQQNSTSHNNLLQLTDEYERAETCPRRFGSTAAALTSALSFRHKNSLHIYLSDLVDCKKLECTNLEQCPMS
jgi:hypothetical protein